MNLRAWISVAALVCAGIPVAATGREAPGRTIEVRSGETVEMTVNGQPVRFRMVPEAISVPTVNADTAERIGLKPSLIGYVYIIGPERIGFNTDKVQYREDEGAFRVRTAFSQRQLVTGADGIAGPETFPFGRTKFILRDPQPGDRAITFPLDRKMGDSQTSVRIDVGGRPVYAAFSIDRAESLVSATGGQWIADAHGGYFEGEARAAPILYGVSRPVRSLKLQRPLMLGELEIRNLAVRVSDMGNASRIADGAAPEPDPNEIFVTADSKRKVPNQRLYIGMDTIGHCASIDYDFAAGTVTLMCPPRT